MAPTLKDIPGVPQEQWGSEGRVGHFRVLGCLGAGGMGIVYRAEDPKLGRIVALKLLSPELGRDPRAKARFFLEARAAAQLDHPNLCTLYEVGETEDGQLYLVMPCYSGETLKDRLAQGPLPVSEAIDIAVQVARGLAYAHEHGIVHRDIKPANLILTSEGLVKILDFGIAKLNSEAGLTRTGFAVGTPAYMSPEQMRGESVDFRADLWAIGAVLYEMLAGRLPFVRESPELSQKAALFSEPEPLDQIRPEVPGALSDFVGHLLAKDREKRPNSAKDIVTALIGSCPHVSKPRGVGSLWRTRTWRASTIGSLTAMLALGVLAIYQKEAPSAPASTLAPISAIAKRPSIAVIGFRNLSEDPKNEWLGTALAEMLTTELAGSSRVRILSGESVARVRQSLSISSPDRLDSSSISRLYTSAGVDYVVVGNYLVVERDDSRKLRVDVRVLSAPRGESIRSLARIGSEYDLFNLVSNIGAELRHGFKLSGVSAEEYRRIRDLLPASYEAAQFYIQGLSRLRTGDTAGAMNFLLRAVQLEPDSAAIHYYLARGWGALGYDSKAVEEARRAVKLSASLPRAQRLEIEAQFRIANREWEKASHIYRSLWTFSPDELEYGLKLVASLARSGNRAEAVEVLRELRKLPAPTGDSPKIDLQEAALARQIEDQNSLMRLAEAAVRKGLKSGDKLIVAEALVLKGHALLDMEKSIEAIDNFREAKALFADVGDQRGVSNSLNHIAIVLHRQGNFDGAEALFREAYDISQGLGHIEWTAIHIGNLGRVYRDRGDLSSALDSLEQAQDLYAQNGLWMNGARVQYDIGIIRWLQGRPSEALENFERALAITRQKGSRADEAWTLHCLGIILSRQGNLSKAGDYHQQAFLLLDQLGDPFRAMAALTESAYVVNRLGDPAEARGLYKKALQARQKYGHRLGVAHIGGALAGLALETGDLSSARKLANDQLQMAREMGADRFVAEGLRIVGRCDMESGDIKAARQSLMESLRQSQEQTDEIGAADTRQELAYLALAEGNFAEAVRLTQDLEEWYGTREMPGDAARAAAIRAEVLLRQGFASKAATAASSARSQVERTQDRVVRLAIAPLLARVTASAEAVPMALQELRLALQEAERTGFLLAAFEIRLALGDLQRQVDSTSSQATLEALRRDAERQGFGRIARRAAELLTPARKPVQLSKPAGETPAVPGGTTRTTARSRTAPHPPVPDR